MRHILEIDIPITLRRGKSVEQFLGRSLADEEYIRYVELRPNDGLVEVWVYDVEDVGDEEYLDLYDFPYLEPDGPDSPLATFNDAIAAVQFASSSLSANPDRWVNFGIGQSEYLDYIRAGRPSKWPVAT
jgi:hypothetical protein